MRDHHITSKKIHFELFYESHTEKYNNYTHWVQTEIALLDCMDDTDENLVVEYAKNDSHDPEVKFELLEYITKTIGKTKDAGLKKAYTKEYYMPAEKHGTGMSQVGDCKCALEHENPLDEKEFHPIIYKDYFLDGKSIGYLHSTKCCKCEQTIEGSKLPTEDRPTYVCKAVLRGHKPDECIGKSIWCHQCATETGHDGKSSRRGRR